MEYRYTPHKATATTHPWVVIPGEIWNIYIHPTKTWYKYTQPTKHTTQLLLQMSANEDEILSANEIGCK